MIISKDAIKNILNRILKLDKKVESHTHTIAQVNNLQSTLNGKASSSHTHTKSQITDMPTTMKNPNSITVQLNGGTTEGTNKYTYDGSSAKSLNITASSVGAAASNHSHSYLPLSGGTLTGELGLNNSKPIRVKDTNGDYKYLIGMGDGNVIWLGNADNKLTIQSDERVFFKKANVDTHYAVVETSSVDNEAIFGDQTKGSTALNSYIRVGPNKLQYQNGSTTNNIYHSGNFNPSDYLPKSGGTMTGNINFMDAILIGRTITGEPAAERNHRIVIGGAGEDRMVFDEYGGDFYFRRTKDGASDQMARITSDGIYEGATLLKNKYATKSHTHTISNVTGLQDKLDELFQSGNNGKNTLETSIIAKGGIVSKSGSIATFNELSNGIKSIKSLDSSLNIFTQVNEPSTKDGIWLKTSNTYNDILNIRDTEYSAAYTKMADIPYEFYNGSAVAIGNDIYLLGTCNGVYRKNNYKYDTTTNTYTKMANIPYEFYNGSAVAVGNDIYLLGSRYSGYYQNNYKYDTLTDTYTKMTDIPYLFYEGSAVVIGNNIYLLGTYNGNYKINYKYDTTTDTYTKMTDIPYEFYDGSAVAIGNDIYILGSSYGSYYKINYKYDTTTDTYTKMTDIPYKFYDGSAVAIGNDIYILGSSSYNNNYYNYKYDTTTDTYTKMTDIPYEFYDGSAVAIGNDIYILGGNGSKTTNYKYNTTVLLYKNSILFLYDNESFKYKTKIFNTSYDGLNYINFNSFIITDENGNNTNVETYIGNGTSWDKI